SLERFDGTIWSSNRQYEPAKGVLGSDVDVHDAHFTPMQAQFTISALSSFWLPAPFRPVKLAGTDARYDTDSNSLLTEADTTTAPWRRSCSGPSGATASSSRGPMPPWPAPSGCPRGSPSGSRPATTTPPPASTSCTASTGTPGPRCTSTATAGWPSSRHRA